MRPYDKTSIEGVIVRYGFRKIVVNSFGLARGVGRLGLYQLFKKLIFSGSDLIYIGRKDG